MSAYAQPWNACAGDHAVLGSFLFWRVFLGVFFVLVDTLGSFFVLVDTLGSFALASALGAFIPTDDSEDIQVVLLPDGAPESPPIRSKG